MTLKAPPDELFNTFLDPKKHAAVTGAKVTISCEVGAKFTAFDGMLLGRNLLVIPQ